jgi:hypothetical protein
MEHNMNRDEYLASCKRRALEYLDRGDVSNAVASMGSDLMKHDDFRGIAEKLMPLGMMCAMQHDVPGARRFIEGFR